MFVRGALLFAAGLSVGIACAPAHDEPSDAAKSQLLAAQQVWTLIQLFEETGGVTYGSDDLELRYRWSRRLVDSQLAAGATPKDAYRDHRSRMQDLAVNVRRLADAGRVSYVDVDTVAYFTAEADTLAETR